MLLPNNLSELAFNILSKHYMLSKHFMLRSLVISIDPPSERRKDNESIQNYAQYDYSLDSICCFLCRYSLSFHASVIPIPVPEKELVKLEFWAAQVAM